MTLVIIYQLNLNLVLNNVYYIYHFLENNEPKKLDIGNIVLQ